MDNAEILIAFSNLLTGNQLQIQTTNGGCLIAITKEDEDGEPIYHSTRLHSTQMRLLANQLLELADYVDEENV